MDDTLAIPSHAPVLPVLRSSLDAQRRLSRHGVRRDGAAKGMGVTFHNLTPHRPARPVGHWVDAPPVLENTDVLGRRLKGFHGSFAKIQQARSFLDEATHAEREGAPPTP